MSLDLADTALGRPRAAEQSETEPSTTRKRPVVAITATLTIIALLLAWTVAAHFKLVSALFLPSPFEAGRAFLRVASEGFVDATLWQHLSASLGRVFAALVATTLIAVPIGFSIGASPIGRGIFDPIIEFLRPIPPLAYLPLVIIWFGIGEPSKVLIIGISMLAPIVISTASGVKGVDTDRVNAARSLGATRAQLVRHVVLPSALPSILTGIRIALGVGWSTLVAAELVAASRGLGFMIQSAAQFLVTDVVLMGILVIAAVAVALEAVLRWIERRLVPWAGKA
ncbi:ABC transporter permease subunit [Kaistia terrae]|uniref:ABC transporter permease subunit n=1 Tax=Kaistia terrae TaxID=537017 RepID=A0ABW0PPY5_9HYPH|nr:ABC transporter permease subunit [Kaistia terrae]MCX5577924.1 ABC transporter permease subunit [Kaistia terrae]